MPPPSAAGAVHFWLAAPVQVQIWIGVPLAEVLPVTSAHLFACGLTRSRAAETVHFWLAPPVQSHSWSLAPSAVELPATSRHLPRARTVPSEPTVHCWAVVPLQS